MRLAKRLFDLFWTALGLLLLWPVFVLVACLIKLDDGGPVFYRQERVGLGGRSFRIWKFRTMVADADKLGAALTVIQDPRVTRVGRGLRMTKLDELPQLLNVLTGAMSLVGPRPEVPQYVAQYGPELRAVLQLVPGITDPAALAHWDERVFAHTSDPERTYIEELVPAKIQLSLNYAKGATVWSDFVLILKTLGKLFTQGEFVVERT